MRLNAEAAGAVERGAARAEAEAEARDDDAAARRSEGARVWRRRHMAAVVVVFSGRPPCGGGVEWTVEWEWRCRPPWASNAPSL